MVDTRLMGLLFNTFHLSKHCDAIRRYVLLGQGDFVQALMDMVGGPGCGMGVWNGVCGMGCEVLLGQGDFVQAFMDMVGALPSTSKRRDISVGRGVEWGVWRADV